MTAEPDPDWLAVVRYRYLNEPDFHAMVEYVVRERTAGTPSAHIATILALHHPVEEDGYADECVNMDCEHQDGATNLVECPTVKFMVCAHCANLSNGGGMWEDVIPGQVMWPCETARAAGATT